MRRPVQRASTLALAALLGIATLASGQGRQRSRQDANTSTNLGIVGPPVIPAGVASLVLEHADVVGINDTQRAAIEKIKATQDAAIRPYLAKLDSLRPTRRPAGGENDLSQEQRDEINERKVAITAVLDAIHEPNATARQQTMALLTEDQQKKAADLENEAKKKADEDQKRRERNIFGAPGMGGGMSGGRGRPPEL
ncbi:MAG: hypothetical protein JWM95_70 [Gemmatimonadetes bacterium]|nr:hypothetical protein [Gemmatimonadota bacterium]